MGRLRHHPGIPPSSVCPALSSRLGALLLLHLGQDVTLPAQESTDMVLWGTGALQLCTALLSQLPRAPLWVSGIHHEWLISWVLVLGSGRAHPRGDGGHGSRNGGNPVSRGPFNLLCPPQKQQPCPPHKLTLQELCKHSTQQAAEALRMDQAQAALVTAVPPTSPIESRSRAPMNPRPPGGSLQGSAE